MLVVPTMCPRTNRILLTSHFKILKKNKNFLSVKNYIIKIRKIKIHNIENYRLNLK